MMEKKIYTVATAHLDTIWSWDFETTVSKYIYNTLVENIALLKKYPSYVFSFEGSYRYELMEEYYPELFKEMSRYIEEGRWNVTGSAFENGDVNCPSPEALFRNILFGNSYFEEKFGKRSKDIFLPDCFGFGWALPSIAHHANLLGFTTQKLAWGGAYGVPFDIGKWYGVDGNYIYASLNPHDYYFTLTKLRSWDFVLNKLKENEKYGLDMTYIFHGIGDRGGAPKEKSIKFVEDEIKGNDKSNIKVIAASADEIFRDIDNELPQSTKDKLPEWKTELVMLNHGVGGYTSRAIGKRWNSKCQELADMAERSGVMAEYFGVSKYNEKVLERAWKRFIAHQFHDDTPGTSVQRAYRRSWNDYALSANQFIGETEAYINAFSKLMKSDMTIGEPILVYNSVEVNRVSAVQAKIKCKSNSKIRVFDDMGLEVKSQILSREDGTAEVLFIANVPPVGVRVYDIRESDVSCQVQNELTITANKLENQKYIVTLNKNGDIGSIIDKSDNNRELLKSPIVFGLFKYTGSKNWPAWEMNYNEVNKEPDRIPSLLSVRQAEKGPVRIAFEVIQNDGNSIFKKYISLTDGGETVDVFNEIEWQSMHALCKNVFSLTADNEKALYDLGLGAIERNNMSEKLFEVPAQKWADITNNDDSFGVSIISECKHGWDKFDNNTLRLTAVHTPKRNYRIDSMQSMMDLGLNRYSYAVYSHKGKVSENTQLFAKCFVSPLAAFSMTKHPGVNGSVYSFVQMSSNDIIIRALKKAHHKNNNEIIVRFNEGSRKKINDFEFSMGSGIESAKEVWASEEYRGDAVVRDGKLICDFKPYEIKTFAVTLKPLQHSEIRSECLPIKLNYNESIDYIPENLRQKQIEVCGTTFLLGDGAVSCNGQEIKIKPGHSLKLLCASMGEENVHFSVNGKDCITKVNNAFEAFAGWDLYDFGETAHIKSGQLGYEFTHTMKDGKIQFAKGMYFWLVTLDGNTILPKNKDIIILAAAESTPDESKILTELFDTVENYRPFTFKKGLKEKIWYINSKLIWNINDKDDYFRHNNNGKNGKRIEQSKKHYSTQIIKP